MGEDGRRFVITPLALFEMKPEVGFNAIELSQPSLRKAPEGFDAVDVSAAIGEGFLLVDAHMLVVANINQSIIPRPAIGAENACRVDPASNDGAQSGLGAVRDDFGINFSLPLEDAEDRLLAGASAAQPGQSSASDPVCSKITLVDFDHSSQTAALSHALQNNEESKPVIKAVDRLAVESQKRRRLGRG